MNLPSFKFAATATIIALVTILGFREYVHRLYPTQVEVISSPAEVIETSPYSRRSDYEPGVTPVFIKCSAQPRYFGATPAGWDTHRFHKKCLSIKAPPNWVIAEGTSGVSAWERTDHEDAYGETAWPGELTSKLELRIHDSHEQGDYRPSAEFPDLALVMEMSSYERESSGVYARGQRLMPTQVIDYKLFHHDGFIIDVTGHSPENDRARRDELLEIVRNIRIGPYKFDAKELSQKQ